MVLDQRVILFPPVILLTAMRLRATQTRNPLPHDAPEKVIFDPSKEIALAIRFPSADNGNSGPRDFRFSRNDVFQALLLYCKHHDVPIPREGIKRLDEINGRVAMMIYLGQTGPLADAQPTGRGPVKVVNLVRKLLKDVPPRTSKSDIAKKLWRRSSFCVIENQTMTRRALRSALINSGATSVDVCTDETEFMKTYGAEDAKAFDVIVMGGLTEARREDILAQVRRTSFPSNLAIAIAVMAFADTTEVQKIVTGGFHGILLAPFTRQALERLVTQLLLTDLLFEQHGDMMKPVLMKKAAMPTKR